MSLGRSLLRRQMRRARRLWDKLARKGQLSGYACLTCEEWLGGVLEDEDDRAALYGAHSLQCKGPMISQLAPPVRLTSSLEIGARPTIPAPRLVRR